MSKRDVMYDVIAAFFWVLLGVGVVAIWWQPVKFFGRVIYREFTEPPVVKAHHKTMDEIISDCEYYRELRYTRTCVEFLGLP
jgi:hypothetical protein